MPSAAPRRWWPGLMLCAALGLLAACGPRSSAPSLDGFANDYLHLAHTLGTLAPEELDFHFWLPAPAEDAALVSGGRGALTAAIQERRAALAALPELAASERGQELLRRFDELSRLSDLQAPTGFAAQVAALYGLTPRPPQAETLEAARADLEALLPGTGALLPRLEQWQRHLMIAPERARVVFERALAECRARTARHWNLPASEQLLLEYQGRNGAAAWHSYVGAWRGALALEPRALTQVSAVLDLACHEGYPGHQMQFLLIEQGGLLPEDTVVLTRSRQSVLREGAAMLAVELAFSAEERLVFERNVLFPLAGLPPDLAERNLRIDAAVRDLQAAIPVILGEFLDGGLNFSEARLRLETQALVSGAPELLQYALRHGSYLAGYTVQAQALREELEAAGPLHSEAAWRLLRHRLAARQENPGRLSTR